VNTATIALTIAFIIINLMILGIISLRKTNKRLSEYLEHYRSTYLNLNGCTTLVPNANPYHLFSPNGGLNWYALGRKDEILGTAEEVHPGLLSQIVGMRALTDFVTSHGPIGSGGQVTSGEIDLLETAGFTVQSSGANQ
jgi:hypothetical protein